MTNHGKEKEIWLSVFSLVTSQVPWIGSRTSTIISKCLSWEQVLQEYLDRRWPVWVKYANNVLEDWGLIEQKYWEEAK